MAKIIFGAAASHTPLLTLTSEQWLHRAAADLNNKELNPSDGRKLTYEALLAEVGPKYKDVIDPDTLSRKAQACAEALDRIASALERAQPDIAIIVGDDQRELFFSDNQPAISIFYGPEVVMSGKHGGEDHPDWVRQMGRGYLMDENHAFPGSPEIALELIRELIELGFDVATASHVAHPEAAGFGHAYGFIVKRLLRGRTVPVIPVLLNTYYQPNVPSPARCLDLGFAIRRAIEAMPEELRVAVIASGGLSHFVVDEALDRSILNAIAERNWPLLRAVPRGALNSGSSEILNWIATAGAASGLQVAWSEYQPLYRTPAGTGVGAGFLVWEQA